MHAGGDRQFADRSKQQDQSKKQVDKVVAKWIPAGREVCVGGMVG